MPNRLVVSSALTSLAADTLECYNFHHCSQDGIEVVVVKMRTSRFSCGFKIGKDSQLRLDLQGQWLQWAICRETWRKRHGKGRERQANGGDVAPGSKWQPLSHCLTPSCPQEISITKCAHCQELTRSPLCLMQLEGFSSHFVLHPGLGNAELCPEL